MFSIVNGVRNRTMSTISIETKDGMLPLLEAFTQKNKELCLDHSKTEATRNEQNHTALRMLHIISQVSSIPNCAYSMIK